MTLKFLSGYPSQIGNFLEFDAIDWQQVLTAIGENTDLPIEGDGLNNLAAAATKARQKFRHKPCDTCGMRKQTSWTQLSVKAMSEEVGLGALHFQSFILPSKLMHPSLYGARERVSGISAVYNMMNYMHHLLVENVLISRRNCLGRNACSPATQFAVRSFLDIWVYAQTPFDGMLVSFEERPRGNLYF